MTEALRLLGTIYMEKGMPFQARTVLEAALVSDSTDLQVLLRLGQTYSQLERYESAEKTFRRAASLAPGEPMFHYYIGLVCEMSNRPAEAIQSLERFLEIAPEHEMVPAVKKMIDKLKQEAG
jgi:tetratricopeptide (TPR) repeat protein